MAGVSVQVRLADGAESGLANIVQQYLEQNLEESEPRRRRARRLRGRVAMTAADHALGFDPLKPQRRKTVPTTRPIPAQSGGVGTGVKVLLYLSLGMNAILIVLLILIISLLVKLAPQGGFFGGPPSPSQPTPTETTGTPTP